MYRSLVSLGRYIPKYFILFIAMFADDMILCIENPKDSTRKLLELIKEYRNVAGYKVNTQKSLAFLYTNNEKVEEEIKETIPFTIAMKRIKYLGIYLPKETKDLYIGNYKTLVKEIKEDTNRWRNIPRSWIGRIPTVFFTKLEQIVSQFVWKYRNPQIAKAILRKKNGTGGINFLTSGSTTKPQSSRQYGTSTKTEI